MRFCESLCSEGHALCSEGHALCSEGHALCSEGHALCSEGHALYSEGHALCSEGHALCSEGHALLMGINECLLWPEFGIKDLHIILFTILQLCENWCFGDCTFLMGLHGVTFVQFYLYVYHGTM